MGNIKKYIIILFPQTEVSALVEDFRIQKTGQNLVDNLSPHITFKRSFLLNPGFSEKNLIDFFNNLNYKKFKIYFERVEALGGALVLLGESKEIRIAHEKIVNDLQKKTITEKPEWELAGYKIHLTLRRDISSTTNIEVPKINQTIVDRMALYEIGDGSYANLITSVNLD